MALARLRRLARFGSAGAKIDPLFLISCESDTLYHFFSLLRVASPPWKEGADDPAPFVWRAFRSACAGRDGGTPAHVDRPTSARFCGQ